MESPIVHSLHEFTRHVEYVENDWELSLFRGQSSDLKLIPSIGRLKLSYSKLIENEKVIIKEFQDGSVPYYSTRLENIWEWLALAQHYGLPTRFLDWSRNPYAALWFAVNNPAKSNDQIGVVWILRPSDSDNATRKEMNSIECSRHVIYQPRLITERITAQSAYFTVHKGLRNDTNFEPLEESKEFRHKLTKLLIPSDRFAHFRFHLNRFGINDGSIYPGLEGLSKQIRRNCSLAEDENWVNTNIDDDNSKKF
jgi:hypothetical protein